MWLIIAQVCLLVFGKTREVSNNRSTTRHLQAVTSSPVNSAGTTSWNSGNSCHGDRQTGRGSTAIAKVTVIDPFTLKVMISTHTTFNCHLIDHAPIPHVNARDQPLPRTTPTLLHLHMHESTILVLLMHAVLYCVWSEHVE